MWFATSWYCRDSTFSGFENPSSNTSIAWHKCLSPSLTYAATASKANIYTTTFQTIIGSIINIISTICTVAMKPPPRRGILCHTLYKHLAKDGPDVAGLAV